MIASIDDHKAVYGVEPIRRVVPIAPSTYYDHVARRRDPNRLPARARRDAELKIAVRRVYEENFRVYGVWKLWRQHPAGRSRGTLLRYAGRAAMAA